jgi:hypothetical protein
MIIFSITNLTLRPQHPKYEFEASSAEDFYKKLFLWYFSEREKNTNEILLLDVTVGFGDFAYKLGLGSFYYIESKYLQFDDDTLPETCQYKELFKTHHTDLDDSEWQDFGVELNNIDFQDFEFLIELLVVFIFRFESKGLLELSKAVLLTNKDKQNFRNSLFTWVCEISSGWSDSENIENFLMNN